MFKTSEQTDLLDIALAKAQGEFGNATKNAVNPHFRSKYADLAAIWDVVRDPLAKHEIHVTQWLIETSEARINILTRISHKGQYMQATSSVPVSKNDAQGTGSASTYGKRYALAAALGIATEDDDGNAATHRSQIAQLDPSGRIPPGAAQLPTFDPPPAVRPARFPISEAQVKRMFAIGREKGWNDETLHQYLKKVSKGALTSIKQLDNRQYEKFCTEIQAMTPEEALKGQAT